ncbi:MAG: hypothetical protein Q4D98_12520 [Planctomycetia bacterium]|nr:hypothetical protein [Planctomycetia bacterium]
MAKVDTSKSGWFNAPTECDPEFYESDRQEIEYWKEIFSQRGGFCEERKMLETAPPPTPPQGQQPRKMSKWEKENRERMRKTLLRVQKWLTPEESRRLFSYLDNTEDKQWEMRIKYSPEWFVAIHCHHSHGNY